MYVPNEPTANPTSRERNEPFLSSHPIHNAQVGPVRTPANSPVSDCVHGERETEVNETLLSRLTLSSPEAVSGPSTSAQEVQHAGPVPFYALHPPSGKIVSNSP